MSIAPARLIKRRCRACGLSRLARPDECIICPRCELLRGVRRPMTRDRGMIDFPHWARRHRGSTLRNHEEHP